MEPLNLLKMEIFQEGKKTIVYLYGIGAVCFSYETPIAWYTEEGFEWEHEGVTYKSDPFAWVLRKNEWSTTTGRHLNSLSYREGSTLKDRLPTDVWKTGYEAFMKGFSWKTE